MQWIKNDTRPPITGQFMTKPDVEVQKPETDSSAPAPQIISPAAITPAVVVPKKPEPPSFAVRHPKPVSIRHR